MRTGHTIQEIIYITIKTLNEKTGRFDDTHLRAPTGTRVEWHGRTNEPFRNHYGGRRLYWMTLPDHDDHSVGLKEGVDFVWDDEEADS